MSGATDATNRSATGLRARRSFLRRDAIAEIVILLALILLFSFLNPGAFPTQTNLNTILNNAAIPAVNGVGSSFVVLTGRIDLSVEGVMGAAGMIFVLLSANSRETADLGWLALIIALGAGGQFGVVTGCCTLG